MQVAFGLNHSTIEYVIYACGKSASLLLEVYSDDLIIIENVWFKMSDLSLLSFILLLRCVMRTIGLLGRRRTRYTSLDAFVASSLRRRLYPQSTPEQDEGVDWMKCGAAPLRPLRCKTKALSKSTSLTSSPHRKAHGRIRLTVTGPARMSVLRAASVIAFTVMTVCNLLS
jgi:hypothetical protein